MFPEPQNPPLSGERLRVFEEADNLAWPALVSKACAEEIIGDGSPKAGQYAAFVLDDPESFDLDLVQTSLAGTRQSVGVL